MNHSLKTESSVSTGGVIDQLNGVEKVQLTVKDVPLPLMVKGALKFSNTNCTGVFVFDGFLPTGDKKKDGSRSKDHKLSVIKVYKANHDHFVDEGKLLKTLNNKYKHDSPVPVVYELESISVQGDFKYVRLERCPISLGDFIEEVYSRLNKTLSPTFVALLIRELLKQVNELHQKDYSHNDLSVDSIMLTHQCYPVIVNYGKALDEERRKNALKLELGPETKTAPEMTKKGGVFIRDIDLKKLDVYCLGMVMYKLVNGVGPVLNRKGLVDVSLIGEQE